MKELYTKLTLRDILRKANSEGLVELFFCDDCGEQVEKDGLCSKCRGKASDI
mgnify:CR=1 FL=1